MPGAMPPTIDASSGYKLIPISGNANTMMKNIIEPFLYLFACSLCSGFKLALCLADTINETNHSPKANNKAANQPTNHQVLNAASKAVQSKFGSVPPTTEPTNIVGLMVIVFAAILIKFNIFYSFMINIILRVQTFLVVDYYH
ncbi:hypothetical protein FACS1894166_08070 [Bacilli bacterium]|nr:hypothetical protein FACS1894166_08070 [Bacilli bacterium]